MTPEAVRTTIAGQFQSSLAMLTKAIELCPETQWLEGSPNRYWHLAYHALFYVHFYLSPGHTEYSPWEKSRPEYNFLGEVPWRPGERAKVDEPYSQAELLEYAALCRSEVDSRLADDDLEAPSGFPWIPLTRLGLHLYNLRHLAHHTGQLGERLRTQAGIGLPWIR